MALRAGDQYPSIETSIVPRLRQRCDSLSEQAARVILSLRADKARLTERVQELTELATRGRPGPE